MKKLRILMGCEESQVGMIAFRNKGHEAYSCDLQPCSGGFPQYHIQDDIRNVMNTGEWDMMIGHPYCTYNTNAANKWLSFDSKQCTVEERLIRRDIGLELFRDMWQADIPKICLENPQPHPYVYEWVGKFHDKIQPWMFGEDETKGLCLWLKNLPPLMSTIISTVREPKKHMMAPGPERTKERSKSFPLVMEAMADQWG